MRNARDDLSQPAHKVRRKEPPAADLESERPRNGLAAVLESLQHTAGNAAVSQILSAQRSAEPATDGGQPLPPTLRTTAERKLATDFADVRVHADESADAFARSVGAEAATVAHDVFMRRTSAGFDSPRGRRTLLHELAHVAQASGSDRLASSAVSDPGGPAEREARQIAGSGPGTMPMPPTQVAPAGVIHRVAVDEEEKPKDENAAEPMPNFLNPEPLPEAEDTGPKTPEPGKSGENESIVYEVTVMQPLRTAVAAVEQQNWEDAYAALQSIGMRLMNYQNLYEKTNPLLYHEFMAARGWIGLVYQQIERRLGKDVWSDDRIAGGFKDAVAMFESLESKLDTAGTPH